MKVTQPSPDELLISDFPVLIGGFCAVGFFLSACVLLAASLSRPVHISTLLESAFATTLLGIGAVLLLRRTSIRFDRRTGRMTWSRWGVLGTRKGEIALSDIVDVAVEVLKGGSIGHGPSRPSYRVALVTSTARWPLTTYYSSGQAKSEKIKAALQDFLRLSDAAK